MSREPKYVILAYDPDGTVHIVGTPRGNPMTHAAAVKAEDRQAQFFDDVSVVQIESG